MCLLGFLSLLCLSRRADYPTPHRQGSKRALVLVVGSEGTEEPFLHREETEYLSRGTNSPEVRPTAPSRPLFPDALG